MFMKTLSLCSIVPTSTLNLLTNTHSPYPPASGDPLVYYSLFPCELSSAVGCDHLSSYHLYLSSRQRHRHPGRNSANLALPPSSRSSGSRSPRVPSSIFSLDLLWLNFCASYEDSLDRTSTQRTLYSVSTRASSPREKKPL